MERLTKDNEKLVEQIALCEAQTRAQAEDTQAAKVALSEVTARRKKSMYSCERKVPWSTSNLRKFVLS